MGYSPKFKWNDELVYEFVKLATAGSYGVFAGLRTLDEKLSKFKAYVEDRNREARTIRVLAGKRGMNEDGSRFYYDNRGVKWTIQRVVIDNESYYIAESEKNEAFRLKFLSDIYLTIDRETYKQSNSNQTEINLSNDLQKILK